MYGQSTFYNYSTNFHNNAMEILKNFVKIFGGYFGYLKTLKLSSAQEQRNSSEGPFCRAFFALQEEIPHVSRTTLSCFVHRAFVDILRLLLINWNGLNKYHRHVWCEFFKPGVCNHTCLCVPPSSLHEQAMDVRPFAWWAIKVLFVLFGDINR